MRNITIDIAKGLGILLVVLGHLGGNVGSQPEAIAFMKRFLYQFHVPLFFFLSGLFYKADETWQVFLTKKIKRLYIPYLVANLIFLILDIGLRVICGIAIIPINEIKHAIKLVLGIAVTPMGGATWFLIALLKASVLFKLIDWSFKHNKFISGALSIALGLIGMSVYHDTSLVALFFFWFGVTTRDMFFQLASVRQGLKWAGLLLTLAILLMIKPYNQVDYSASLYSSIPLAIFGSIVGIVFILFLSDLIKNSKFITKFFSFYGRKSMNILIGHFAAFKIVILFQVLITGASMQMILSHPCYDISSYWSIIYFIAGITLPLIKLYAT